MGTIKRKRSQHARGRNRNHWISYSPSRETGRVIIVGTRTDGTVLKRDADRVTNTKLPVWFRIRATSRSEATDKLREAAREGLPLGPGSPLPLPGGAGELFRRSP